MWNCFRTLNIQLIEKWNELNKDMNLKIYSERSQLLSSQLLCHWQEDFVKIVVAILWGEDKA